MTQNTGKPYEKLTRRVFEALLAQQSVTNLRLDHDVKLQGITNWHQVDVCWEFETGGITYRTVVECKDWQKPVDQETLFALHTVLLDLPGQPRGVVVARSGFQDGAEQFAKAHGIVLYELRAPRDEDWEGFVTGVNIKGELLVPKLHAVEFKTDEAWLTQELRRCGIASAASLPPVTGLAGELRIEREDGSTLTTVGDVIESHLVPPRGPPEWREYLFPETAYIATGFPALPRVRLRGLRVQIELVVAYTQNIEVRLETLVGLILKEVTNGTFTMLDADGRPIEPGQPRPGKIVVVSDDGE
jgi:hypothetical protein